MQKRKLSEAQLVRLLQVSIEQTRREIEPAMPASKLLLLIQAVRNPGARRSRIVRLVPGVSTTACDRHLTDWGAVDKEGAPSVDFIQQRRAPGYRRRKLVYPTPLGFEFFESLTHSVNVALSKMRRP